MAVGSIGDRFAPLPMPLRESDILERISGRVGRAQAQGPGDDMALLPASAPGARLLVGADAMIEGLHFLRGTDWRAVGRKAIHRNLSDVAAMGAEPLACTACAQFRPDQDLGDVDHLLEGLIAACDAAGCPLIGGDTSIHGSSAHPFVISVTILATLSAEHAPFTRCGAVPGQGVYVTGTLGGSFGDGFGRHLTFDARLVQSRALRTMHQARTLTIGAMMDISDGLGQDATRIARASNARLTLDAALIPVTTGCSLTQAMSDGEDYELLFTATNAPASVADIPCTRIGVVEAPSALAPAGAWLMGPSEHDSGRASMQPRCLADSGWDHGRR